VVSLVNVAIQNPGYLTWSLMHWLRQFQNYCMWSCQTCSFMGSGEVLFFQSNS